MSIIDLLLWAFLFVGLGLPPLFRLISEEVGAAKTKPRAGAIFALCSMMALWGVRDLAHRRAVGILDSHTYGQENPIRLGAFPSPINPFSWTGVVETDSAFHVLPVNALDTDADTEHSTVYHKPDTTPALESARKTHAAEVFLDFARFPWANVEDSDDGFSVTIQDLRAASPRADRRAFYVDVELDKNLRVLSADFHILGRRP